MSQLDLAPHPLSIRLKNISACVTIRKFCFYYNCRFGTAISWCKVKTNLFWFFYLKMSCVIGKLYEEIRRSNFNDFFLLYLTRSFYKHGFFLHNSPVHSCSYMRTRQVCYRTQNKNGKGKYWYCLAQTIDGHTGRFELLYL